MLIGSGVPISVLALEWTENFKAIIKGNSFFKEYFHEITNFLIFFEIRPRGLSGSCADIQRTLKSLASLRYHHRLNFLWTWASGLS